MKDLEKSRKVSEEQWEPNKRQHFYCIIIKVLPALKSNARDLCGSKHLSTVTADRRACAAVIRYPRTLHSVRLK